MKKSTLVKIIGFFITFMWVIFVGSCENMKEYKEPTDDIPPGNVTSVNVENLPGGANITYTLPSDTDLLGVKAVYYLHEGGQEYEIFSSAHRDTISLAGFSDTSERIVNLYAIDQSRNLSEPVAVTVKPLTPPFELVRQSLKVKETFGGVYVEWENIMGEDIAVSLYVDSIGEMTIDDTYYSTALEGNHSFRGYPNNEYHFRVEIRDRWQNYAMPLDTVLTPMFEEQIFGRDPVTSRQMWFLWGRDTRECWSRGDIGLQDWDGYPSARLFDGSYSANNSWWRPGTDWGLLSNYIPNWPNDGVYAKVNYYTIDLSRADNFSRMKLWYRAVANFSIFSKFEVWGINEPKPLIPELTDEDRIANLRYWTNWEEVDGTDEWKNDWIQLGDFVVNLPSGATRYVDATPEDFLYLRSGVDFDFNPSYSTVPIRYIRIVAKESIGSVVTGPGLQMRCNLTELELFGSYLND